MSILEVSSECNFVDPLGQVAFLDELYFSERGFLPQGGSKIKFVKGSTGSGKTCFLKKVLRNAKNQGYLTGFIDAKDLNIHKIDDLYRGFLEPMDVWSVVRHFSEKIIAALGTDPNEIPQGENYYEWSIKNGRPHGIIVREVQQTLEKWLFKDADIQRTFSIALMQMVGIWLGTQGLREVQDKVNLENWVRGQKMSARDRNRLNLRQQNERYSARLMLRSWLHFVKLSGFSGTVVAVDNLDVIMNTDKTKSLPYYTKAKRNDFYETVRELIDDVDGLESFMFLLAAQTELYTDAKLGLRSYPALWMRIQNEVNPDHSQSGAVNRFSEVIDLDHLWDAAGPKALVKVGSQVAKGELGRDTPDISDIEDLVSDVFGQKDLTISVLKRTIEAVKRQWRYRQ